MGLNTSSAWVRFFPNTAAKLQVSKQPIPSRLWLRSVMIERATGLVLRARPLTETSLIVNWLTSNLGRLATVAKGARGPKSPFRGKLDLFYLADFTFTRGRTTDLHKLREVSVR